MRCVGGQEETEDTFVVQADFKGWRLGSGSGQQVRSKFIVLSKLLGRYIAPL
jgi:hypothetical protein